MSGAVILTTVCTAPAQRIPTGKTPRSRTGNCVVCDLYLGRYISRFPACVPRCSTFSDLLAHDFSTPTTVAFCRCQSRSRIGTGPLGRYGCQRLPCGQQDRHSPLPHPATSARSAASTSSRPGAGACSRSSTRPGSCACPCACSRTCANSGTRTHSRAMRRGNCRVRHRWRHAASEHPHGPRARAHQPD